MKNQISVGILATHQLMATSLYILNIYLIFPGEGSSDQEYTFASRLSDTPFPYSTISRRGWKHIDYHRHGECGGVGPRVSDPNADGPAL